MVLCSSTEKECQNCAAVCYEVSHFCKLKADLQPAHSLFLASLFALHSYLFFPLIKADHPSVSAASAMSLAMHCLQWFDAEIDLASHFLNVNWHDNTLLTPLSLPGSTLHAWREQGWFFFSLHVVSTGFPRNCYIRPGWSGKGRVAWSRTSLKSKSCPSWA